VRWCCWRKYWNQHLALPFCCCQVDHASAFREFAQLHGKAYLGDAAEYARRHEAFQVCNAYQPAVVMGCPDGALISVVNTLISGGPSSSSCCAAAGVEGQVDVSFLRKQ
jgi:hypothetical protein